MNDIEIHLLINYSDSSESFKFHFYLSSETTFDDLLDFVSTFKTKKLICCCYNFFIQIYSFYNCNYEWKPIEMNEKMENLIKRNKCEIKLSENEGECICGKIMQYSKTKIIKMYNQLKENFENINNKNNENLRTIKKLEDEISIIKSAIDKDFETLNKLKEFGIAEDLKESNTLIINKKTNEIMPNKPSISQKNEKIFDNDFENFYDVIINIKSVKDLTKGWKIKMNERGKKNYEQYKDKKILKIGVIGNANKGKSYILSKISKIDLPSGTSIRTKGLSIKYPDLEIFIDRKIALLDSAGLETPVLRDNKNGKNNLDSKELFKEKSREKLITELFLQNYIIHNSDILILVVGILTYSEQKLLNRIVTEVKRAKINKPLYIIHNLKTFVEQVQVEEYIKKYLLQSATFTLVKGEKISTKITENTGIHFYEEGTKIFHLIFANEQSNAGLFYNRYTLEFLEKTYQSVTDLKSFDVIKTVKERFIEISKEIIENKEKKIFLMEDFDENDELIKLKNIENITLKKCLIDELGFSNLKGNGFEPNYNYYQKDENLIVRVECPGNSKCVANLDYSGEFTIIKLKGIKKRDLEPEENIYNNREFDEFTLEILYKAGDYLIKNEEPKKEEKKGIIIFSFKLEKKFIAKENEEEEEDMV